MSFTQNDFWNQCKGEKKAKMAFWQRNSHSATFPLLSLIINLNSFSATSILVLIKMCLIYLPFPLQSAWLFKFAYGKRGVAYIGYRISYYEDANVFRLYWWRASAFVKRNVQLLRHAVRPIPNCGQCHNWTRHSNSIFDFNKLCYNETSEGTWLLR